MILDRITDILWSNCVEGKHRGSTMALRAFQAFVVVTEQAVRAATCMPNIIPKTHNSNHKKKVPTGQRNKGLVVSYKVPSSDVCHTAVASTVV